MKFFVLAAARCQVVPDMSFGRQSCWCLFYHSLLASRPPKANRQSTCSRIAGTATRKTTTTRSTQRQQNWRRMKYFLICWQECVMYVSAGTTNSTVKCSMFQEHILRLPACLPAIHKYCEQVGSTLSNPSTLAVIITNQGRIRSFIRHSRQ
jgi:hypothetical protein